MNFFVRFVLVVSFFALSGCSVGQAPDEYQSENSSLKGNGGAIDILKFPKTNKLKPPVSLKEPHFVNQQVSDPGRTALANSRLGLGLQASTPHKRSTPPASTESCSKSYVKNGFLYKCGMNTYHRGPFCKTPNGLGGSTSFRYKCYGQTKYSTATFNRCYTEQELAKERIIRCCNVCYTKP